MLYQLLSPSTTHAYSRFMRPFQCKSTSIVWLQDVWLVWKTYFGQAYSVLWHRIVPARWIRCRYCHRFEGAWTLNRFSWKWAYYLPSHGSNTLQEGGREISPMFILYGPDWVWGHALLMPFSLRNTFVVDDDDGSKGDAVLFQGKQAWYYCPSYRESWYLLIDSNLLLPSSQNCLCLVFHSPCPTGRASGVHWRAQKLVGYLSPPYYVGSFCELPPAWFCL